MVRTARFSAEHFIDAAIALVAAGGPSAATMQAVARHVGAPTGSIYHRFESRSAILAAAWNQSYGSLAEILVPLLQAGRPREAALALLPWASEDRDRARFLLLHEPVALFEDTAPPEPLRQDMARLENAMDQAFRTCIARSGDSTTSDEDLARAKFLIFDAPIALLRPHLVTGSAFPPFVGQMIAELHAGVPIASTSRGADDTQAA